MVRYCVAYNCKEKYKKGSGITFHRFPKDPEQRNKWIISTRRKNFVPSSSSHLCSKHFENDCFVKNEYKPFDRFVLKKDAIPTIFNFNADESLPCTDRRTKRKISSDSTEERVVEKGNADESLPSTDRRTKRKISSDSTEERVVEKGNEALSNIPIASTSGVQSQFKKPGFDDTDLRSPPRKRIILKKPRNYDRLRSSSSTITASEIDYLSSASSSPPKSDKLRRTKTKFWNPRYVGDCPSDDLKSPTKSRRNWKIAVSKIEEQQRKIRNLQQWKRRSQTRLYTMKRCLKEMRQKHDLSQNAETTVMATLSDSAKVLLDRMIKCPNSKKKYSEDLRSFAITLNFYSAKAYNFLREKFNNVLPHPSTITKWFKSVDGSPGFTAEAIVALKMKVHEANLKGKKIYCNLVMDEMHIRAQEIWNGSEYKGHINIGTSFSDEVDIATQALVFMLVPINDNWKVPVGYFLLNGLQGHERANLTHRCLEFIHASGVIVVSITFDGQPVNFTMIKELGATFEVIDQMKPEFKHQITGETIYILPDACHMLKLIRNCLASIKIIHNNDGSAICWEYFKKLSDIQEVEGLHAGNKLRRRHIQWFNEKMKVKLAAQTFSRSTADALEWLQKDLKLQQFQGADATIYFCRIINDLFDIFNSRSLLSKYIYKRGITLKNYKTIFDRLEECKQYFLQLKIVDVPIIQSRRKTGFLGFLIGIENLQKIFHNYVAYEDAPLKFLLTYKMSQDHLEILFSCIRSKGGHNNNPNAVQFENAYKRLLVRSEIKSLETGNCIPLDCTSILHVSSGNNSIHVTQTGENLTDEEAYQSVVDQTDHDYVQSEIWHLTLFQCDIVAYIAGFIVKRLKQSIACESCVQLIEVNQSLSFLQNRKQYGKLTNASDLVISICKIAERIYRISQNTINKGKNILEILINQCMRQVPPSIYAKFDNDLEHILASDPCNNHCIQLIKAILKNYFNLRLYHSSKNKMEIQSRIRHKLTKAIHFVNQ